MGFEIIPLFHGFPAKSSRGFLGWSSVYLIKVEEQNQEKFMLFDTGGYNERFELIRRLEELNLNLKDINSVFISHLHFDHAVNWTLFPNANIYISSRELIAQETVEDLMIPDFHCEKLKNHINTKKIEEGDVIHGFEVVSLPGHTLNLMGLKRGETYLVSDAIKNRREIQKSRLTNTINKELAVSTIDFIINNANIIYPGHDVPLIKRSGNWEPVINNEMSILYSDYLIDLNGKSKIQLNIKD